MVKRLITKAELAREAKISRAAVGKLCKSKPEGKLFAAMDGKLIDLDHQSVIDYLKSKQSPKTSKGGKTAKSTKAKAAKKTTVESSEVSEDESTSTCAPKPENSHYSKAKDIQKVMDMPLRELLKIHGTDIKFQLWASGAKTISDIVWKDLQSAKLKETLIPREMVEIHIFGAIENTHLRLLNDFPETSTKRIYALAKAGEPIEKAVLLSRELISIQLKDSKTTAKRLLSNGTTGD